MSKLYNYYLWNCNDKTILDFNQILRFSRNFLVVFAYEFSKKLKNRKITSKYHLDSICYRKLMFPTNNSFLGRHKKFKKKTTKCYNQYIPCFTQNLKKKKKMSARQYFHFIYSGITISRYDILGVHNTVIKWFFFEFTNYLLSLSVKIMILL